MPYPDAEDRRAILQIYDQKRLGLSLDPAALEHAVRQTGHPIEGSDSATGRWSGDHIQALCRAIARMRLRDGRDRAGRASATEYLERPSLTTSEEALTANPRPAPS